MFAIANDRKSLWQWDLNQQLTVAGDCTEVHYLDRGAPSTLTVAVKDGKADIPNILLQKAGRLVVYAYIIDAQDHHTKICETFGISARPKPDDYVYTETEVKTWSNLQSQIGDLADLETEAKENLVAAINEAAETKAAGGTDISLGLTSAAVGQIIKVKAIDESGKPTAWEAANMPSGGSGGGHWETVLDTVWEQDVINPTAFDSETGIFTCAEGELNNLELNKEYVFFQQCVKGGVAYNTILNADGAKVTKLSDTTFSIDVTPPATFVPTNVKFSRGACLAVTDIDAKKIRLTLDGQFKPTATGYDAICFGLREPYFALNTSYQTIRNAYQAYQQVTAEVESPYRIVGEIICGFNAPSQNGNFHFKNNSFCCPLVPYDVPQGNARTYFLTSDGTKIAKLYSTSIPWAFGGAFAIGNDYLKIISGTKVKLERWVE